MTTSIDLDVSVAFPIYFDYDNIRPNRQSMPRYSCKSLMIGLKLREMSKQNRVKISKFLSLILRHKPEEVGLTLDDNGWVNVTDLIKACADAGKSFTLSELQEVVETNDKKRFVFDVTGEKIRASQGHSVEVDLEFGKKTPPGILYHGTAERNVGEIMAGGLKKMKRHHVHLSAETETARTVGKRYGQPVIFKIDTFAMMNEGFEFYVSANGVWLVDRFRQSFWKYWNKCTMADFDVNHGVRV
jgi:putative RNA 2'-phosphotransferase